MYALRFVLKTLRPEQEGMLFPWTGWKRYE